MQKKNKNKKSDISSDFIFSTKKTCEFFEISREALSSWEKKGAPKFARGKWNLKDLIKWRYGGGCHDSPEVRKFKAEADLKEAKARQEQIKLGVIEAEYILASTVTADLKRFFTVFKRNVMSIGHDIATELHSFDPQLALESKKIVDKHIHEALEQMSMFGVYNGKKK